jgi:hypothetical protein
VLAVNRRTFFISLAGVASLVTGEAIAQNGTRSSVQHVRDAAERSAASRNAR